MDTAADILWRLRGKEYVSRFIGADHDKAHLVIEEDVEKLNAIVSQYRLKAVKRDDGDEWCLIENIFADLDQLPL